MSQNPLAPRVPIGRVVGRVAAVPGYYSLQSVESCLVTFTVEACPMPLLRVLLRKFKRRGVADEALRHIQSRPYKPRIWGWKKRMGIFIRRISHIVPAKPDLRLSEGRLQATVQHPKLFSFRIQNFNVLFADFEQLHVDGIASKVVRDRDNLAVGFYVMILVHHLNINDNARSTQV